MKTSTLTPQARAVIARLTRSSHEAALLLRWARHLAVARGSSTIRKADVEAALMVAGPQFLPCPESQCSHIYCDWYGNDWRDCPAEASR